MLTLLPDNNDLSDGAKIIFSHDYPSSIEPKPNGYESMIAVPDLHHHHHHHHQFNMGQPSLVIQQNNTFISRHISR